MYPDGTETTSFSESGLLFLATAALLFSVFLRQLLVWTPERRLETEQDVGKHTIRLRSARDNIFVN